MLNDLTFSTVGKSHMGLLSLIILVIPFLSPSVCVTICFCHQMSVSPYVSVTKCLCHHSFLSPNVSVTICSSPNVRIPTVCNEICNALRYACLTEQPEGRRSTRKNNRTHMAFRPVRIIYNDHGTCYLIYSNFDQL